MVIATTAGYGVTMKTLASTATNFMGGVRPEIMAFVGGGKKRKATKRKSTKRKATKRKATKRKATKRKATKRKATKRKSTKRKATIRKATIRKATKRKATKRKATKRKATKRKAIVKNITLGDRKKRLKNRLNDRKIRRSIIKDIESGKREMAKKKIKSLSAKSKQSSMHSFLSSIESGSMPASRTLRLSDMTSDTK